MRTPATWLYVPSVKERIMHKAIASSADVIIFDLEDSVPESEKESARNNIKNIFSNTDRNYLSCIRVNQVSTTEGVADLLFLRENNICPDYILLPKADMEKDAWFAMNLLGFFEKPPRLFLLIETVSSFVQFRNLSEKPEHVEGVFFGSADFSADLCVSPADNEFLWARQEIALQSRRLNIPAIDTPCFNIHDRESNSRHARQARDMGFVGLQLIHPKQLEDIDFSFSLDPSEFKEMTTSIDDARQNGDCAVQRFDNFVFGPPLLRYVRNMEKRMDNENAD